MAIELVRYPNRPKTNDFELVVPFNDQNDNSGNKGQGEGYRQCNLTCAAMLAKFFIPTLWAGYSDFANGMQDVLRPYGDTTDHHAITKALKDIGIESYFSYSASINDANHGLYMGTPVLIGTSYKRDGHMILLIGRSPERLLAHNPFGIRDGASNNWVKIGNNSGAREALSNKWMKDCFVDQGSESGWARFVTSVKGVTTGVRTNM